MNENKKAFGLAGVGPQIAKHLARLNIHSIQDLLLHLPVRYQDRTQVTPLRFLRPTSEVVIEGVVTRVDIPNKGRTKFICELQDQGARLYLRFFNIYPTQRKLFVLGTKLRCFGEVRFGQLGLEMMHPECKVVMEKSIAPETHLTPVYAGTQGVSQYLFRKLTTNALHCLARQLDWQELIPEYLLQKLALPTLKNALQFIHRPPNNTSQLELLEAKTEAHSRIIFEELLAHRLSLLRIKQQFKAQTSIVLNLQGHLVVRFLNQLPFKLTSAQARVHAEIQADLQREMPMLRLVQGDVGSGKTVIAALAALQAIENQYQTALMAPTELLAEQHYHVFKKWFVPLGVNVVLLTSSIKGTARKTLLQSIENADAHIVIGTHAIFQEHVKFSRLALVIVDEQHRFGVQQRSSLRDKGVREQQFPHQLIMTATPIPRTLAMSFYADLDCSTIDELPPGRTPITTSVLANNKRLEVIASVRKACAAGRQAYWVCPLIEESEMLNCEAVHSIAVDLQAAMPELKIAVIHGRMTSSEKEAVMGAFQQAEIQLLIATTVIEVGVDVPNASLMIIENAERLGLSQLHQLRGRVGRGSVASHCVLLYQYPLSAVAKERLQVMRETNDGFKIAQRDLELRGPGEVFGTKQTGELLFKVANLVRDVALLPKVQEISAHILEKHAELIEPLLKRWLVRSDGWGKV